jgi:sec-independent protein translocase protein TatA
MVALFGFFDLLGSSELLIIAVIAVLLYGERLPEVARSFGKQFVEFKKSLQGIREDIESAASDATSAVTRSVSTVENYDREEATAPKFEPPPSEPAAQTH